MITAHNAVPGTLFDEIGVASWAVVYLFTVRQGFKDRSYGIPLAAICLNVTWESFFAFFCSPAMGADLCFSGTDLLFVRAWAVVDLILLYQLLRFGRAEQSNPLLKNRFGFYAVIVMFLVVGYLGQTTFIIAHTDSSGDEMAWISSLIMNLLFILAVFQPQGLKGLSLPAAWFKLVANSCIAIGLLQMGMAPFENQAGNQFMFFLFGAVFLTDCGYILAFYWRRRQPAVLAVA